MTFRIPLDAGHFGPGAPYLIYANLLLLETLGLLNVFDPRPWLEPLGFTIEGLIIFVIHVPILILAYSNEDHHHIQSNWLHVFAGLYIAAAGLTEMLFNSEFMKAHFLAQTATPTHIDTETVDDAIRHASQQPEHYEKKEETPVLLVRQHIKPIRPVKWVIPSVFLLLGVMIMSHSQSTEYQTFLHQSFGMLSTLFGLSRALSYYFREYTIITSFLGMCAAWNFIVAGKNAHLYLNDTWGISAQQILFIIFGVTAFWILLVLCFAAFVRRNQLIQYGEYRPIIFSPTTKRKILASFALVLGVFLLWITVDTLQEYHVFGL
mmetsp:Transcript_33057/g.83096  ORF Transcript_33057/g.83096 Transcript_33057/m.83096 type:complete len:320 (-) Transcript_33057:35-994(-)|eukprot:CAMPEP_0177653410 /NCGR_PEP_ID=MMETSP0447-20121125/13720_1 /TAXON_ID=0 /ORGANISM="Stygamoeba regulata, Strain BSH-02190019" /LENGTH=319 /DNA_ID=CAMNT_0019156863 /DNA_START=109 /DNA_END=1068 /DNA_ORIENTATION=-